MGMLRIAWAMLTADRTKYLGMVAAVAFATLMLQNQTSIFAGIMLRTAHQVLDVAEADLWVMDSGTHYFDETRGLPGGAVERVRAVAGVAWAVPLRKRNATLRTAEGRFRQALVIGVDDGSLVGMPRRMVLGAAEDLRQPDAMIIDRAGFIELFPGQPLALGAVVESGDQRLVIVGISEASAPFAPFPIVHVRGTVASLMPVPPREDISFVVAGAATGHAPTALAEDIARATGLRARTTADFSWDCIGFYLGNTGIPVNFGITIALAVLIGAAVSGLTFSLFVRDNLSAFAALKAIGVTNRGILGMALFQALAVVAIGCALGTGMSAVFFEILSTQIATRGITMPVSITLGAVVVLLTVVVAASAASIRSVLRLDPAEVFRA